MLETLSQWLHNPMVVQGIGIFAAMVGISSYLSTNDRMLKTGIATATFILGFHLYLLGATAGSVLMCIAAVRFLVAARTQDKRVGMFFIAVHITAGVFVYDAPLDLLPIISSVNAAFAVFFLAGISMRLMLMVSMFLWLVYNTLVISYGGALLESFYIIANLITLSRMTLFKAKT